MQRKTRNAILARLVWYALAWALFAALYWLHTGAPYLTCLALAVSAVEGVLLIEREERARWGRIQLQRQNRSSYKE